VSASWKIWRNEDGLKVKCSVCDGALKNAVVIQEHGLSICFACLSEIWRAVREETK